MLKQKERVEVKNSNEFAFGHKFAWEGSEGLELISKQLPTRNMRGNEEISSRGSFSRSFRESIRSEYRFSPGQVSVFHVAFHLQAHDLLIFEAFPRTSLDSTTNEFIWVEISGEF
jgi:hypothetical protein